MESLNYEDNPLMQEIRKNYGNDRRASERAADASSDVQIEFRSGGAEGRQSGGKESRDVDEAARGIPGNAKSKRAAKTGTSGKGRTNTKADQGNIGADSSNGSTDNEIQRDQRKRMKDAKEKPSGIETKPNSREKAARKEKQ